MFDDTMDQNDAGLREVRRRLDAYADLRLTPSVAATTNMRTSVMNAAHRRAALMAADRAQEAAATTEARATEHAGARAGRFSRPAAAFMAASLAVAMFAGSVHAVKAGGPLYASRLWVEAANLPAGLVARAQAESVRLDRRIAEVQQASSDGDAPAAEAALGAYSAIVAEAVLGAAGDPTANATIEISIARHVTVLTQLRGTVPTAARAAVQAALVSSAKVIANLDGQSTPPDSGQPTSTGAGGAPQLDSKASPRPKPAARPEPASGGEVDGKTPAPPTKAPPARDHDSPPPGPSRGPSAVATSPAVRATTGPRSAESDAADPGRSEESSAP